jgi:hypothetical protein
MLTACTIRAIAMMVEAVQTSETSINLYQNTRRYNPDDGHSLSSELWLSWIQWCLNWAQRAISEKMRADCSYQTSLLVTKPIHHPGAFLPVLLLSNLRFERGIDVTYE